MSDPLDRSIFDCQRCHAAPAQHLHLANGLRLCDRCSALERRRVRQFAAPPERDCCRDHRRLYGVGTVCTICGERTRHHA